MPDHPHLPMNFFNIHINRISRAIEEIAHQVEELMKIADGAKVLIENQRVEIIELTRKVKETCPTTTTPST